MKFINGKILTGKNFTEGGLVFDEIIHEVGSNVTGQGDLDLEGAYVIPGLIDIHTHAAMNADASDGSLSGLIRMAEYYAAEGVTGWVPTTMTLDEASLTRAMKAAADYERPEQGARLLGIHMEGPFVSKAKCGAQNPDYLHAPDAAMFRRLNEASGGQICLITVAPEEPGCLEMIREIAGECTVSLGHTMADYETAMKAFEAGASHATHLFNAMPPLGHREAGLIGAAFDSGATVELIVDGFHIAPPVVRMTKQLFGDRLVLVSDSGRCAGMPDGDYDLGGQSITLKEGKACLSGTDTLACSSVHLMEAVRRAVRFGIPLADAVYAASTAPAKVIRKDDKVGSLEFGKRADFVILDKCLQVKAVYIDGKAVRQEDER